MICTGVYGQIPYWASFMVGFASSFPVRRLREVKYGKKALRMRRLASQDNKTVIGDLLYDDGSRIGAIW